MSFDIELIRIVLSDPAFADATPLSLGEIDHFTLYKIHLNGSRYRGIPRTWTVAVLSSAFADTALEVDTHEILSSMHLLIMRAQARFHDPLVFVSAHPHISLGDALRFGPGIFTINHGDLLGTAVAAPLHLSPFILSLRRSIGSGQSSPLPYAPYSPNRPAVGWRFFGRKRELERLTNSPENFFVVGPRRSGKTSLLQEVERILRERGEDVYSVNCQHLTSSEDLMAEIALSLSPREVASAVRRGIAMKERQLHTLLRTVAKKQRRVTIILDELGNLINNRLSITDDWNFFGVFRSLAHSGGIRLLMTGWQEILLRQTEFEGPFVNFATTLSIRGLNDGEISEFILEPLSAWSSVRDPSRLLRLVTSRIGRQPFLLQYFGQAMFESLSRKSGTVDDIAEEMFSSALVPVFEPAVEEILYRNTFSVLHRYLFLRRCREAEEGGMPVNEAEISVSWIDSALQQLGCSLNFDERRSILDAMELQGLTERTGFTHLRHCIAAPILYYCFKEMEQGDVDQVIELFADEVRRKARQALENAN